MHGSTSPARDTRPTRRGFLRVTATAAIGTLAPGRAPAGEALPAVHTGGSDEIRVALIGCGGRGAGAAADALSVPDAPLKLYAVADIFPQQIETRRQKLADLFKDKVDLPDERCFVGMNAYRQAIDCLRPGDIAVLTAPPAFRAPHFARAIDRGAHVFMEKSVSVDGPSTRRMLELAERADARGLKVGVGLMCRHSVARRELFDRLHNGEAGDLIMFYGHRQHGTVMPMDLFPGPPDGMSELMWQVKRFHNFLWASGGVFSDYYVHHIDEVCWMKDAWPVKAEGVGGRHFQGRINDQNFDSYGVEYTFADGTKFFYAGRALQDCEHKFGVFGQGSKGAFTISEQGHSPARSTIYRSRSKDKDNILWTAEQPEKSPYRIEWEHLVAAILAGTPYNEARRGAEASLVTAMGRVSAHTGRTVTYDQMLACPDDLTAGVEALTDDSPPIVSADADGKYPVPMPGRFTYEFRNEG
ncbi:MAG: Gfo/Idh/MocA family protein [Planctomycetaceae bacterium]